MRRAVVERTGYQSQIINKHNTSPTHPTELPHYTATHPRSSWSLRRCIQSYARHFSPIILFTRSSNTFPSLPTLGFPSFPGALALAMAFR